MRTPRIAYHAAKAANKSGAKERQAAARAKKRAEQRAAKKEIEG